MEVMLAFRDSLSRFYGKHDTSIRLIFKFALALWAFMEIRTGLGGNAPLNRLPVIFVLALVCAFVPSNGILIIGAGMMILCLYSVSIEAVIVGGGILLIGLMLYFSIASSSAYPLILTAIFVKMELGCVPAVLFGLIGGPLSAAGIAFGAVLHSLMNTIVQTDGKLQTTSKEAAEAMVQKMAGLIEAVIQNREMLITAAVLASVMLVVYYIRILAVKYAWTIAAIVGSAGYLLFRILLWTFWDTEIMPAAIAVEIIAALLTAKAAELMLYSLDYKKTETVRFEDDEYFYFVKAVPKKKIRRKRRRRRSEGR
ncbi:MAG: hypothetical protein Q4F83_07030 [Eubacteriales bacterium]|nr:hypothetical protein [Eubacteriales bacterium]